MMTIAIPTLADISPPAAVAGLFLAYVAYRALSSWQSLAHIPTVGGSDLPVLSWIGALRSLFGSKALHREGYARYKSGMYKISMLDGWKVILCGRELVDEMRKLPDDVLSFAASAEQFLQTEFIVSHRAAYDMYHVDLVKSVLPKKLESIFPAVHDEIVAAFADALGHVSDNEWTPMNGYLLTREVICRASNRMLVGLPLCRNPEWVKANIAFTTDWVMSATVIRLFPNAFKRAIGWLVNPLPKKIARARDMLLPIIKDHRQKLEGLDPGHPDRPNDFLAWILENNNGDESRTEPQIITEWIKTLNFASIETTSMAFTHALFDLAVHPECVAPLREEIESVVEKHGWTKTAMSELVKLDSFMRESTRVNINSLGAGRMCLREHTFSTGMTIPAGIDVEITTASHEDEDLYPNAKDFLPFRFVDHKVHGSGAPKQFTTVAPDYLLFGIGRHACPGRFFASHEIKAMLAHTLLNYDVKAEVEGVRPKNLGFGAQELPNRDAKILFRKRKV